MTAAFVAPSPSEGARTRRCTSTCSGADEVPFRYRNGSETANRVRSVFGDDSGLRGPQSVRRGADATMYLNVLRRGRSAPFATRERLGDGEPRAKGVRG